MPICYAGASVVVFGIVPRIRTMRSIVVTLFTDLVIFGGSVDFVRRSNEQLWPHNLKRIGGWISPEPARSSASQQLYD